MRNLRGLAVAVAFLLLAFSAAFHGYADDFEIPKQEFKTRDEFAKYREEAFAHFRKRCTESAGEKIYRTIENVKGFFLLKPRRQPTEYELRDQFWSGDPYGHDGDGKLEIVAYLADLDKNGIPVTRRTSHIGYEFVEIAATDGGVIEYRRDDPAMPPTERRLANRTSRYGVTWSDVSTSRDRNYWVAGGKLQVIDLSNGDVLAERTGYLLEAGFGSTSGGRRPWVFARLHYSNQACPAFRRHAHINREFVEKVLRPARTNQDGK